MNQDRIVVRPTESATWYRPASSENTVVVGNKSRNKYVSYKAKKPFLKNPNTKIRDGNPNPQNKSCVLAPTAGPNLGKSGPRELLVQRGSNPAKWYCRGPRRTTTESTRQLYLQWKNTPGKPGAQNTTVHNNGKTYKLKKKVQTWRQFLAPV